MLGDVEYDRDSVDRFDMFRRVYGHWAYQLMSIKLLQGPAIWLAELPNFRRARHHAWVNAATQIQSNYPSEYWPPMGHYPFDRYHPQFFERTSIHEVPETQVYIRNCPELQHREMVYTLLSWFGMVPPR